MGSNYNRRTSKVDYPVIGENVSMMSNAKIIGHALIGDNVTLAANAYVKDMDIPSDSFVFGVSPELVIRRKPIG